MPEPDENLQEENQPGTGSTPASTGNISGPLYLVALMILVVGINLALGYVWPAEDRSLANFPRFATSLVMGFGAAHLLGLRPRQSETSTNHE